MWQKHMVGFEFYPPKTPSGLVKLLDVATALYAYQPEHYSVTFGAGGTTQQHTPNTVQAVMEQGFDALVVPHISCVNVTEAELVAMLQQYRAKGVKRLVVLRGDRPSGSGVDTGPLQYAADLVRLIRHHFDNQFDIVVGCYPECHPEASHLAADFTAFANKVKAGANRAITQYFYNAEAYFRFVDRCQQARLDIDIIPGIMPIHQFDRLKNFSARCGAAIPQWLSQEMKVYDGQPEGQRQLGIEIVTQLCQRLLEAGAPGLHFYTLNQLGVTQSILNNLQQLGYNIGSPQVANVK